MIKQTTPTTPIEESDPFWLVERWEVADRYDEPDHWNRLATILHCCAMAVWDFSPLQRAEYLLLASVADGRYHMIADKMNYRSAA